MARLAASISSDHSKTIRHTFVAFVLLVAHYLGLLSLDSASILVCIGAVNAVDASR